MYFFLSFLQLCLEPKRDLNKLLIKNQELFIWLFSYNKNVFMEMQNLIKFFFQKEWKYCMQSHLLKHTRTQSLYILFSFHLAASWLYFTLLLFFCFYSHHFKKKNIYLFISEGHQCMLSISFSFYLSSGRRLNQRSWWTPSWGVFLRCRRRTKKRYAHRPIPFSYHACAFVSCRCDIRNSYVFIIL